MAKMLVFIYHLAMSFARPSPIPDATKVASMDAAAIVGLLQTQALKIDTLEHQLEWFKRQVFGQKSERALPHVEAHQMHLGGNRQLHGVLVGEVRVRCKPALL